MHSSRFPLISKWLKLEIIPVFGSSSPDKEITYYVRAEDLETKLEKGITFQGINTVNGLSGEQYNKRLYNTTDTHQWFVIGIQPIEKEPTADELLKDVLDQFTVYGGEGHSAIERARAYLARKK